MISINLMGGLGNVMFQIATIEYLGKAFNMDVTYTNVDEWLNGLKNKHWLSHAEDYVDIFPNLDLYKNHNKRFIAKRRAEVVFRYRDLGAEDGDLFVAYFQSERNFGDSGFVKWLFTPSDFIKKRVAEYDHLFNGTTCSISVRRGNYLNYPLLHPALGADYYKRAIEHMKSEGVKKFFIFSNDIHWCKYNFWGDEYRFIEDVDYVELFLMNRCNHHIISNSSFGWWGAWLQEQQDTITIAPKDWFGMQMEEDCAADIIPARWLKF